MRSAFVVIVGRGAHSVPPVALALLHADQPPPGVGFVAGRHLTWSDATDAVALGAWDDARSARPAPWTADPNAGSVAIVSGLVRRNGASWPAPDMQPSLLCTSVETDDHLIADLDELTGAFASVVLNREGIGYAVTDPFGRKVLYVAECPTHRVVASCPALAAWAIAPSGRGPTLDAYGVCGLAYTKHRVGRRTGFAGVQSLPCGTAVGIDPTAGLRIIDRSPPWQPTDDMCAMGEDQLIDLAQSSLEDELRASMTFPTDLLVVDLTGGKDSRLVLAAALSAGVADQCTFHTNGPIDVIDVTVASELAALTGVRWDHGDRNHLHNESLGATRTGRLTPWVGQLSGRGRAEYFVANTAGTCNLWDAKALGANAHVTRLGGFAGETLRSSLHFLAEDEIGLIRRFDRHFGHLELLKPEALAHFRNAWIDELLAPRLQGRSINDRHDAFVLDTQIRSNFGAYEDLMMAPRLMPLLTMTAVRSAFALGGPARTREQLHREIMSRVLPELATHRFAKGGWNTVKPAPDWARRRRRRTRWRQDDRYPPRRDRPPAEPPDASTSLTHLAVHKRREAGSTDATDLLRDLLIETTNPAWDLIEPSAVAAAVDRYDMLGRSAQVELMGAATAALWLSKSVAHWR